MSMESAEASGPRITKASEFRAKCLKLVDEVADSGEEIVITKNGQPVSRLLPYWEKSRSPFGRDRDIIWIHGDLDESMPVGGVKLRTSPTRHCFDTAR